MKKFFNKFHIFLLLIYALLALVSAFLYFNNELYALDVYLFFNISIFLLVLMILLFETINRQRRLRITQLESKIRENKAVNKRKLNNEDIALNYLPVGILIYSDDFHIDYANNAAKDYFSNVLVERPLQLLNKDLFENVEKRVGKFMFEMYDKLFDVVHYPKNKTLYIFEVTERETIKEKYYQNQNAVGILSLDNYIEATANMDYQTKSNIEGSLLQILNKWCQENHIYFISLRVDRAIIITNRKKLDEFMAEGFSILDKVSEKAEEKDIRVSLSMGIASFDESVENLGQVAEEALRLAIDRGGDQVVVYFKNQPV